MFARLGSTEQDAGVLRTTGRARRRVPRRGGLTLIETSLLVSIVGIVLAVSVPTFWRELRTSKVDEASELLEELAARVDAYYVADHGGQTACLPSAAGPAPAETHAAATEVDFVDDELVPGQATWAALGFDPGRPVRYRYEFVPYRDGCGVRPPEGVTLYTLRSTGDLDEDGRLSTFEHSATLGPDGAPRPTGVLRVRDRVE